MLDLVYEEGGLKGPAYARLAKRAIDFLKPMYFTKSSGPQQRKQLSDTAYLDGLRGFAAFIVYWHHHQLWPREFGDLVLENAFGFENRYYFSCLPGIRTFISGGHFAVAVFFIISGYVLSAKPTKLLYAGEYTKFGDNISSALFRRWFRLYISLILTTFVYMTSWHAFGGIWTKAPEHKATYRAELWNWYSEIKGFSFLFRTGAHEWFHYGFHLWSIPVELRGSIVVYTSVLAFSRCTRNARLWLYVGLIFYFMYIVDGSFFSLFVFGTLLCELHLLAKMGNLPQFFLRFEPYKKAIFYSLLGASVWLSGVPSHTREFKELQLSPGWYYLSFLTPQAVFDYKWFYLFWAAAFLVSAVPEVGWLKSFFETRFNQYLGRISFALYLIHGPLLWTLGDRVYVAVGWYSDAHINNIGNWVNLLPLSQIGPMGFEFSFLAANLIILPVTLWVAEMVTKLDEQTVNWTRWAYSSVTESSD